MKEKYWITQDYTTNAYNGNIKTQLKSVVVVFFLFFKGTCHDTMLWGYAYICI